MKKRIKGYEKYIIDEYGVITNTQTKKIKIPTLNYSGNGYLYVDLYNNGIKKRFYIHRLVAETFIKNNYNKPYVNHIDGNTMNNFYKNLEWCSPLENVQHASKVLKKLTAYKKANDKRKRKVNQIDYITGKIIAVFDSIREAERKTGINSSYICQICKGKFKQCFGFSWCYVEEIK